MRDFTLEAYQRCLNALSSNGLNFYTFLELLQNPPDSFIALRHDVDRKPYNALIMAKLESELSLFTTYYFRDRGQSFNPKVIEHIASLGHEVGYHYECLCDAKGNIDRAWEFFEVGLSKLRQCAEVKSISMHGRPLSPHDSRDMWRSGNRDRKLEHYGLLGEVYLDIDYSRVAFISDTGRIWRTGKSNLRDHVHSEIAVDFKDQDELLTYLANPTASKIVFQVHPERWNADLFGWFVQLTKDTGTNMIKNVLQMIRG